MAENLCWTRAPELSAYEELLLIRGNNPMTFLYVGFSADEGFSGGIAVDPDRSGLPENAARLDLAFAAGEPGPFPLIQSEIPPNLLNAALFPSAEARETGYAADQVAALTRMISGRVPDGALDLATRKTLRCDEPLIGWVNYLSCGDREARVQALRAVPLHTGPLLRDPEFRALVDARSPLTPLIASRADLSPAETRRYAQVEARMAVILAWTLEGAEPLTREPIAKPGSYHPPVLRAGTDDLRGLAIIAARRMRTDQVPTSPEEAAELLTYVSESDRIRKAVSLGEEPFLRHMRQVSPATSGEGAWGRACLHLQEQVPVQETSDYLRSVSQALVAGLLVDRLRQSGVVDFDRLGAGAHALREKSDLPDKEAEYLGAFIRTVGEADYLLNGTRSALSRLIGEGHSLKALRESQVRWHHVRQTYENEVMTSREPLAWNPLLGEADLDGVRAVELTSSEDLDRQGRIEKHCVGGYTGTVMGATSDKASLIFSLEKGDEILSTIETRVTRSPWDRKVLSWEIVQNKAARNAAPPREAIGAGERLLETLRDLPKRQIRAYLSGIQTNTTQLRDTLALVTTRIGGDITNPDLPERALGAYEEVLPRALRSGDISALRDAFVARSGPDALREIDRRAERVIAGLPDEAPAPSETADIQIAC